MSTPQPQTVRPDALPMAAREVTGLPLFYGVLGPDGASHATNMTYAVKVNGPLHVAHLQQAIERIFKENPELRVHYAAPDAPPAKFRTDAPPPFSYVDCAGDRRGFRRAVDAALRPDLALWRYPLLHITLVRHSEGRWVLVIVGHHLMMDGWSFMLLLRMLSEYYRALQQGVPCHFAPGCSFEAFVDAQQRERATPEFEELQQTLLTWMTPAIETLRRRRPFAYPPVDERQHLIRFDPAVVEALQARYGQHASVPHRMLFALLCAWITGTLEVAFTEPHPNRGHDAAKKLFSRHATSTTPPAGDGEPNAWRLFGMLSEDLLMRVPLEQEDTVQTLGEKIAMAYVFARQHDRVPASRILTALFGTPMLPRFHFNALSPGFHALRLEDCRVTHLNQQAYFGLAELNVLSISPGRLLLVLDGGEVEGRSFTDLERALQGFARGLCAPEMRVSNLLAAAG